MTEAEWLVCESPVAMLHHLEASGDDRKALLYAVAVCERRPELLTDVLRVWLELADRAVENKAASQEFDRFQEEAEQEASYLANDGPIGTRAQYATIADVVFCNWYHASEEYENDIPSEELEPVRRASADIVRDIFGNPFHPVLFSPAWRSSTAVALASQMYESRDFGAMPILGDALQDAGVTAPTCSITAADRGRMYWVVDLVLGRE